MTASEYIKSHNLPSLIYVAKMVNKNPSTLYDWYKNNFDLFKIVVLGCGLILHPDHTTIVVHKDLLNVEYTGE